MGEKEDESEVGDEEMFPIPAKAINKEKKLKEEIENEQNKEQQMITRESIVANGELSRKIL